jgi:hypothetical protein
MEERLADLCRQAFKLYLSSFEITTVSVRQKRTAQSGDVKVQVNPPYYLFL